MKGAASKTNYNTFHQQPIGLEQEQNHLIFKLLKR